MELFTRETIGNYTSDPYAKNDHKYSKEMQEIRKELRKLDQETKKDGGVVDWNRMLNDFMWWWKKLSKKESSDAVNQLFAQSAVIENFKLLFMVSQLKRFGMIPEDMTVEGVVFLPL